MKRTPLKRFTRLSPRRRKPRRSGRVRDVDYMMRVKGLPCVLSGLPRVLPGMVCSGPVEADHAGARPLGRKCSDDEAAADASDGAGQIEELTMANKQLRARLDESLARERALREAGNELLWQFSQVPGKPTAEAMAAARAWNAAIRAGSPAGEAEYHAIGNPPAAVVQMVRDEYKRRGLDAAAPPVSGPPGDKGGR